MALGDLMASRFSHSAAAVVVSNHSDDYGSRENGEFVRRDPEASSSTGVIYGNATLASSPSSTMVTVTATTEATSMAYLPQNVVLCELRHEAIETCVPAGPAEGGLVSRWRPRERMKTGMVALVLCLNITVDPPDVIKISPCARMECWIDPLSMAPQKAVDMIGKALSLQYERWQPKARYKHQLDPSVEDVKKLCITCRRLAKSERVLFHYNGHGVPKPTSNGEIWVFNKSYTQYIPLPISELDSWLKTPSIYVFDCSAAGLLVNAFMELQDAASSSVSPRDCILLAACEAHETLPQSAEFPADIFTSCLTTPIQMALRWFCKRSLLCESLDYSLIDKIPGHPNDRKTLLGELNWIFTAVTDTIAWNVLPRELFQKLFRQDLLVVSLFRNFLLAERIMRSANCSPISLPMLPPTHQHHMWDAWDMAAEICLSQLPLLVDDPGAEFQPSPFFKEQLTAFEVWLDHGSMQKKPPEQLPIVLQVLHSQCHRFQALVLLGRFLDMGPWAVDLALSVGIFPYVLKLLQKTTPELQQILVFIWTQILALDKSCQVDLVKGGGHLYFIRFLDSLEVYPDHQHAMAAFVLAVIVDGHRRGQEACIEAGLLHVCLRHLQSSTPDDAHTEPLFLQWLCLCLGKLWEDFTDAQMLGLQADAPSICAALLAEPQPEVRASAVFALGTLLDVGFDSSSDGVGGDEECDDNEKLRAEISIIQSLLEVFYDGSPLVRAEVAVALARFAFGHNRHLKSITRTHWRHHPGSGLGSLHLAYVRSTGTDCSPSHYIPSGSIIGPVLRVGGDSASVVRDGRVSTSSPLAISGMMHGSPLSDDSSLHSDSGTSIDAASTGVMNHARHRLLDSGLYTHCILTMCALAKDPSPRIVNIGQRVLSIIGIEQVVARPVRSSGGIGRPVDPSTSASPSLAGLARSSSWFEMSKGQLPLTPPVSPSCTNYLTGMRRVYSLELRPHLLNSTHTGLADPLVAGVPSNPERSFLPQSSIYKWSCGHFSKPLLTAPDDNEELLARREEKEKATLDLIAKCQHYSVSKLNNQIVNWDTKFESGTKTALLQPFSPIVVAADDHEQIRVWNYKEETLLNSFENHNFPDKEISKLCLVNELDDSLLLVASGDGNIRIWKDYCQRGRQKLVTAFSSIRSLRPGVYNANAVVDWQQQSGYLYASEEASPIMLWDLGKEQLTNSIPSRSESDISALAASPVHGGNFAAGFVDGSVRIFDIRTPEMLVCATRPHIHRVERVVGIGFQPGLDPAKIVSASQAGDIQFLDVRNYKEAYLTIDEHGGLLTAFSVHRYAPIIVSGLANQLIKVFSLEGSLLGTIRHYPTFMAQRIRSVRCLAFHPFQVLLAVGAADAFVSIYADENTPAR